MKRGSFKTTPLFFLERKNFMNYDFSIAFDCIFYILKASFPFAILWALCSLAFRSVVNALSGKDVTLK